MRLLVLSRNATLYSTRRLVLAARSRGHEVSVADPLDFRIVISRGRPSLYLGDRPAPHADLVLPRIGASITNYGLAVVRQFDLMGVPVLNTALAIARSRDKLRAMQLLTKRNIDVPVTVCARTPGSIEPALSLVGGAPCIVKLQQGAQGIGTMIAETPQAVTSLLETLWAMGQDIILQQYIAEAKGRDLRAIVVGGPCHRLDATAGQGRRVPVQPAPRRSRSPRSPARQLPACRGRGHARHGPRGGRRRHARDARGAQDPRDQQLAGPRGDRARQRDRRRRSPS